VTPRELALRFALLKVLTDELKKAKAAADLAVRDGWRPGDRLTATLPGTDDLGTVTLANGKTVARLADEAAYEGWVRKVHPEAIETIPATERINPDFTARLMAAAQKLGVAVDAETGEQVPGIEVTQGDPYPMVKLTPEARDAVAAAWTRGNLAALLPGLLAIEGGEES
jgi:hypothetical protein